MADSKLSALTETTTLTSLDEFYVGDGGVSKRATVATLVDQLITGTTPDLNGVGFPSTQVPSADANTLDDYEEGTWNPLLGDGVNFDATQALTSGAYTKIGRNVFLQGRLSTTDIGTISGDLQIAGLPFGSATTIIGSYASLTVGYATGLSLSAGESIAGYITPNTSYINLRTWNTVGGNQPMTEVEWSANGDIMFAINYVAA